MISVHWMYRDRLSRAPRARLVTPEWTRMSDPKDPQRRVAWLNRFFRKIVGPAHVDNSRPGGYYENEHLRHERLDAMGLEMRTDANGHSYVVEKKKPE